MAGARVTGTQHTRIRFRPRGNTAAPSIGGSVVRLGTNTRRIRFKSTADAPNLTPYVGRQELHNTAELGDAAHIRVLVQVPLAAPAGTAAYVGDAVTMQPPLGGTTRVAVRGSTVVVQRPTTNTVRVSTKG